MVNVVLIRVYSSAEESGEHPARDPAAANVKTCADVAQRAISEKWKKMRLFHAHFFVH